jgi:serine protease Do
MKIIGPHPELFFALVVVCFVATLNASAADEYSPEYPMIAKVTTYEQVTSGGAASSRTKINESLAFVVEQDGHLLTSYRSLLDSAGYNLAYAIEVELIGGTAPHRFAASIVGLEPTLNIAILKIDPGRDLRVSKISRREELETAQAIHAVARFEDGRPILTKGTITQLNTMECYQESLTSTYLEAQIDLSDSVVGGPIFNEGGEVVALHNGYVPPASSVHDESDLETQHVLPIFLAFNIYQSLKFKGSLKSPWTGFSVRPLTAEESSIFPTPKRFLGGIAIDYVWKNSPASRLGIRVGDILVGFNYYQTKSPAEFQKWLYWHGVGFEVELHIIRAGGRYLKFDYLIEERPFWAKPR